MSSHSIVRIKPAMPSSGSRISLHTIDRVLAGFIPLNLFFRPSSTGATERQNFVTSLQDVLNRLPLIAGSIYDVEDARGGTSKVLVDDGRGADLIWVESPIVYADLHQSLDVSPRTLLGCQKYSEDQPLLMVKFTKFICGTLAMGISVSHMLADCASCVELVKEWARVSRGDFMSAPLAITSWERHPGIFFVSPIPGDRLEGVCSPVDVNPSPDNIRLPTPPPEDTRLSNAATPPPEDIHLPVTSPPENARLPPYVAPPPENIRLPADITRPLPSGAPMLSNWFFTWESLRELKNICTATEPNDWVSTGDCVNAVAWRAITIARQAFFEPRLDVHLTVSADGRSRTKMQAEASKYFGNLLTPYTTTLSKSSLLEGSLASVALACRRALIEQLTETNCANILASSRTAEAIERGLYDVSHSWLSSWTKYPLVGDALDFGGGAPFWANTEVFFPGLILIVPEQDGYLVSFMIESELESNLHTINELLAYAKPVISL